MELEAKHNLVKLQEEEKQEQKKDEFDTKKITKNVVENQDKFIFAIKEFIKILDEENVIVSAEECKKLETTTFFTDQKINRALYPKSRQEVQSILDPRQKMRCCV